MKYFKNIHSLSELKKQFRTLAIDNHPDKGGDTAVMQEINAEFDVMFKILKDRPDVPKTSEEKQESGQAYRKRFYTEYGWCGSRYDSSLRTADISARIKVYTKERYPEYKFSVRTELFSMGSAIHVRLVSGPVPALAPDCERSYISTMSEIRNYPGITDEVRAVMSDVIDYANSYNYDDSDSMIDYFDTRFYLHIYIGSFEKPYQVVTPKAKKVTGRTRKAEALEPSAQAEPSATVADASKADAAVLMVDYSAKAVAVIGDTKAIKDDLKAMGGRFNRALTIEGERVAGWIFSKSKEGEIMEYINKLNSQPGTLEDVEPMAAPESVAGLPVSSEAEPMQEEPKGEAVRGRMGCVVCRGLVWYITPGDWIYQDESGVYCEESGEPMEFAGVEDAERNAPRRDTGTRGRYFLHEWEAYKYAEELQKQDTAEPMAAHPETVADPEGVAMDEITAGVELLQGLNQEEIYRCLKSASDTLRESPEFWRMINEGDDPAACIGKTALACLLTLGRKVKQGAA